jgi:nucleoside-triphosphatase
MPTLFLTGRPGVGKTTVIKRIVETLGEEADGFYTEEIREAGRRQGFRLVGLRGEQVTMAHARLRGRGRPRVGRYGVDVAALDRVGVAALERAIAQHRVVIIDEIGKMELFSPAFKRAVAAAIDRQAPVIATVMARPQSWVDALKARPDVTLWEMTLENREGMASRALEWACAVQDSGSHASQGEGPQGNIKDGS